MDIKPTTLFEDDQGMLWVGDAFGRVLCHDGAEWTQYDTSLERRINSIWCYEGVVRAVADDGVILSFDGSTWTRSDAPYPVDLFRIWGTGADNIWIVGYAGTILRLVDGTWERLTTSVIESMYAIAGTGPEDMHFGGDGGTYFHFDGQELTAPDTIVETDIKDLVIAPDGALFVAAGSLFECRGGIWKKAADGPPCTGLAFVGDRLFGMSFSGIMEFVDFSWDLTYVHYMYRMHGNGGDRLAIIAQGGDVLTYDGEFDELLTPQATLIFDVDGFDATDVYAVGADGLVLHFDGIEWRPEDLSTERDFHGLWCADGGSIVAVGDDVLAVKKDDLWSVQEGADLGSMHKIWGTGLDDLYTIGSHGTILHFDGSEWTKMTHPTDQLLCGIWGSGPSDVYVVSAGGCSGGGDIMHYDGETWEIVYNARRTPLYTVWGTAADNVIAVGSDGGDFYQYDGDTWVKNDYLWDPPTNDVHGNSAYNIYAGGYEGGFWHWDGSDWHMVEPRLPDQLTDDIWCAPDGQVFVVARPGGILRYGP